jgi:hypothetical protein
MPRKGKKPDTEVTDAQREARRQNIVAFNAQRANRPAAKSLIQSKSVVDDGRVPAEVPDAAEINAEVDALVAQMIADLGGESEVTANRETIIRAQRTVLTVLALAQRYVVREGLVNRKGKPHPLLGLLVSYVNSARLNAIALGLERRARRVGPADLTEYLLEAKPEAPAPGERETEL